MLNRTEINSRTDIALENYSKTIHIEALTLIEMIKRDVIPAISDYTVSLCKSVQNKKLISENIDCIAEKSVIDKLSLLNNKLYSLVEQLDNEVEKVQKIDDVMKNAQIYHDSVLWLMRSIRHAADTAETLISRKLWPYPTYGDLLFKI